MNIYVGNLPYSIRDDELRTTFEAYGDVISAEVIMDRRTRRSRGYGFVEMSDADGSRAIEELNGSDLQGRALRVDESRPNTEKQARPAQGSGNKRRDNRDNAKADNNDSPGLFGFIKRLFD